MRMRGELLICVASLLLWGCFGSEEVDISDYPDVPRLAGRCVELLQPMFLVKRTEQNIRAEGLARYILVRPGESFAPFSVEEYLSGNHKPDDFAEVMELVASGTQIRLDRVWQLKSFEGSIPALTARMEHGEETLTVNVIKILETDWYLAIGDGEVHPTERPGVAGKQVLDTDFARFCDGEAEPD